MKVYRIGRNEVSEKYRVASQRVSVGKWTLTGVNFGTRLCVTGAYTAERVDLPASSARTGSARHKGYCSENAHASCRKRAVSASENFGYIMMDR